MTKIRNTIMTEEMGREGPTGRYLEVRKAWLVDAGNNVRGEATTVRGMARVKAPQGIACRWIAAVTGKTIRPEDVRPENVI